MLESKTSSGKNTTQKGIKIMLNDKELAVCSYTLMFPVVNLFTLFQNADPTF